MRVLVAVASKHGATRDIAEAIARSLREAGIDALAENVEDVTNVAAYDAFVLGSAVYMGNWLEPARRFVDRHGDELAARPTWLFSSGPTGDPPLPSMGSAVNIDSIAATTRAKDHRLFGGTLDRTRLSFAERAVVLAVRATEGDFRDWDQITRWAAGIAAELRG